MNPNPTTVNVTFRRISNLCWKYDNLAYRLRPLETLFRAADENLKQIQTEIRVLRDMPGSPVTAARLQVLRNSLPRAIVNRFATGLPVHHLLQEFNELRQTLEGLMRRFNSEVTIVLSSGKDVAALEKMIDWINFGGFWRIAEGISTLDVYDVRQTAAILHIHLPDQNYNW